MIEIIGGVLLVLLLPALVPADVPGDFGFPPNPHRSMNEPGVCPECHLSFRGSLDPHGFAVPIPEKCWACHSREKLGRSHPIDVDPRYAEPEVRVPPQLPLENGKVSCGTCHQPHKAHLSKVKAYSSQEFAFLQETDDEEVRWYKSFFLRMSDPEKGIVPLCMSCHKDY